MQQHFIEPFKFHHGSIILLHELFNGLVVPIVFIIFEAKFIGEITLVIEQQAILTTASQVVQAATNFPEQVLAFEQAVEFVLL